MVHCSRKSDFYTKGYFKRHDKKTLCALCGPYVILSFRHLKASSHHTFSFRCLHTQLIRLL